ncbi:MAG: DMT family transporter [Hamadaea sp.]|uniref:DMT family transporter n=1 Tax=Hamadaea sp. TaxID=2024425 RepID=UPI0018557A87|nr:DMT family transporter [Hamadaea sp.]NUR71687.1 DMT family transporter [Hamadaea sp.]NUT18179.1 DMT family transporter [Hamadaea sp.]
MKLSYALCVLGMTIVGSSVAVSRLVTAYPMLTGQALRYAVAAVLLFGVARFFPAPVRTRPTRRDLTLLVALGAVGLAAFNAFVLIGLRHAEPAVIGTAIGAAPLILALLGPVLAGRRPATRLVTASAVVVAGTAVVEGLGRTDAIGLAAAVGALACEAAFSLLAAPLLPGLGAVRVSAYSCLLAVPLLVIGAVATGEVAAMRMPTLLEAVGLAYLAVFVTVVAFIAWFLGMQQLGVERAGVLVGVLPLATLAVASIMDGQLPELGAATGVLVVVAGLALPHITLPHISRRRRAALGREQARPVYLGLPEDSIQRPGSGRAASLS